jgi:hypothetical protein
MMDLSQLPSLPLAERKKLPDVSGIYFAMSADGEVLYVGRTRSLFLRWQTHHRFRQLEVVPGVRIAWLTADRSSLPDKERSFITDFSPPLNRTRVPRIPGQKIAVGFTCSQRLFVVLAKMAKDEDRSLSQLVERLLRTHPRVQAILAKEPNAAA